MTIDYVELWHYKTNEVLFKGTPFDALQWLESQPEECVVTNMHPVYLYVFHVAIGLD